MAEGEGRTISSFGYGMEGGLPTNELDTHTEKPITDRLSVVAKTYSKSSPLKDAEDIEVALKRSVFRSGGAALAVQAGPIWTDEPQPDCTRFGAEVRLLGGASFARGAAFANVEVGARNRSSRCGHLRLDATVGYKPTSNWLVLAQSFADQDLSHDSVIKTQLSAVRFTSEGRGLQIGLRTQLQGGEFIAPTLIVGYWSKAR